MTSKLAPMHVILSADKREESLRCIEANSLILGIPRHFVPRNDTFLLVIASAAGAKQSPQQKDCFVALTGSSQ
jgi:hypothetical protein